MKHPPGGEPAHDAIGDPLYRGDCVERLGKERYAVMGLSECCGEEIAVLGEVVGGKLARPFCEATNLLRKID